MEQLFEHPRHLYEEVPRPKGQDKETKVDKVIIFPMDVMAEYPLMHPSFGFSGRDGLWYREGYHSSHRDQDADSAGPSKYISERMTNGVASAVKVMQTYEFPMQIREEALRNAHRLISAMSINRKPSMLRNQIRGRFDVTALKRTVTDLAAGRFSAETTRPFKLRTPNAAIPPHIGITASANWERLWNDQEYVPHIMGLCLGVAWACEAVGMNITASINRGLKLGSQKLDIGSVMLFDKDYSPNLRSFLPMLHSDMYRLAIATMWGSHPDTRALRGGDRDYIGNESADSDHRSINWLKQRGCEYTIAIGEFGDSKQADIRIGDKINIAEAIDKIAVYAMDAFAERQAA